MEEFMFFIRKNAAKEDTFSNERYNTFLQGCESYIEKLKKEDKSMSEKAIILTKNGNKLTETAALTTERTGILVDYQHILTENIESALDSINQIFLKTGIDNARVEVYRIKTKDNNSYLFQSMI